MALGNSFTLEEHRTLARLGCRRLRTRFLDAVLLAQFTEGDIEWTY